MKTIYESATATVGAPESAQAFGQRSKQHLSELVFGREVELHTHGLDRSSGAQHIHPHTARG
jgi:hypothetical protein